MSESFGAPLIDHLKKLDVKPGDTLVLELPEGCDTWGEYVPYDPDNKPDCQLLPNLLLRAAVELDPAKYPQRTIYDCHDSSQPYPFGALYNADTGERIPKAFYFNLETGEYRHYMEDEQGGFLLSPDKNEVMMGEGRCRLRFVPKDGGEPIEMPVRSQREHGINCPELHGVGACHCDEIDTAGRERCCFILDNGERCFNMASYWVGSNSVDDYTHVCSVHVERVKLPGDVVVSQKEGWPAGYSVPPRKPASADDPADYQSYRNLLPERVRRQPRPNTYQTWGDFIAEAEFYDHVAGSVFLWVPQDDPPEAFVLNPVHIRESVNHPGCWLVQKDNDSSEVVIPKEQFIQPVLDMSVPPRKLLPEPLGEIPAAIVEKLKQGIPVVLPAMSPLLPAHAEQAVCPQGHHLKDGPCRYLYCSCPCQRCRVQCEEGGR